MKKYLSVFLFFSLLTLMLFSPAAEAAALKGKPSKTTKTTSISSSVSKTKEASVNSETKNKVEQSIMRGAWLGKWASTLNTAIQDFNALSNHKNEIIHTFVYSTQDMNHWEDFMDAVNREGALNLITLQLKKGDMTDYNTIEINNGELDHYFARIARQFKSWENGTKEIWLRPLHEVNGDWYGWCVGNSKINTNESYKAAFQRIVNIFRENGADNVKFVYNVNYENKGKATYMGAYPGDDYVDYLSIDGYNWGTTQWWSKWQTFRQIFDAPYKALTSASDKPVIIAEIGSSEQGGDKAAWIRDMKTQISSGVYPKLIANIWFNDNTDMDCKINTSESSLLAYIK